MPTPADLMNSWMANRQAAEQEQMRTQAIQQAMQQAARQVAMRGPGMQAFQGALNVPPPPPPQAMQQPQPQPGAMSPGGGNPMAMGGASVMAPQPQRPPMPQMTGMMPGGGVTPQPIPPFRPMPTSAPQQGMAQIPQPPQEQQKPPEQAPPPPHIDIKQVLAQMDKAGLTPEQKADAMTSLMPMIQAAQQDELKFYRAQTAAQSAAIQAYRAVLARDLGERNVAVKEKDVERKTEQGDEKNKIAREKLGKQAGGSGNIKRWETDNAGNVVGGWTNSGKHIKLDEPGTARKDKQSQAGAVRQNIVKAGITNSIARLNEIEKTFPTGTTSSFFGQSGQNPVTRAAYGAGKSLQGKDQQNIDAKWASMIDEAIPVFTGGLRGSDAFRRFLIEQAPGPGDKPETVKEKMRLFRQNIEGTSKAFFNKYSSDPSFWGPGVTEAQIKGGGQAPEVGTVQDGYRFKGGDPASPDSWEKE